ncbi:hypothetical protein BDZ94DRAFT_1325394 [Collybia nuda]|uniref:F-box domain-containing protein n=1 Tax=Collybia nuda TaxID=64659 RepID=A0A9P5XXX6_9AGAR|nr:hypothetical protein BDZ94DRAFT_1325394 [Collybia nuda]
MKFPDRSVSEYPDRIEASLHIARDEEKGYLRTQLKTAEGLLHQLDTEFCILLARRSRVIKHINRYRTLLAPYSRLPTELIGEIIKYYVGKPLPLPSIYGRNDSRILITQVCSPWRKAAFGIEEIWNVEINEIPTNGVRHLIRAWFEQCSSQRISLSMPDDLRPSTYYNSGPMVDEIITPYSHRFHSLTDLIVGIGQLTSIPFSSLLNLSYRYQKPDVEQPGWITAPSLQSLRITRIDDLQRPNLLRDLPRFPWNQLTSITLVGSLSISDIYQIVPQCPELRRCVFYNVNKDSPEIPPNKRLHLPHLTELEIEFGHLSFYQRLFDFSAPALSSLAVNLPPITDGEMVHRFVRFIGSSPLREYTVLGYGGLTIPAMEMVLYAIPSITIFRSKHHYISPLILSKIVIGGILPNIKVLEVSMSRRDHVEDILDLILRDTMLRPSRLTEVVLYSDLWSITPQSERIDELRSKGLYISISPSPAPRDPMRGIAPDPPNAFSQYSGYTYF